jgi:hypothetical protein
MSSSFNWGEIELANQRWKPIYIFSYVLMHVKCSSWLYSLVWMLFKESLYDVECLAFIFFHGRSTFASSFLTSDCQPARRLFQTVIMAIGLGLTSKFVVNGRRLPCLQVWKEANAEMSRHLMLYMSHGHFMMWCRKWLLSRHSMAVIS